MALATSLEQRTLPINIGVIQTLLIQPQVALHHHAPFQSRSVQNHAVFVIQRFDFASPSKIGVNVHRFGTLTFAPLVGVGGIKTSPPISLNFIQPQPSGVRVIAPPFVHHFSLASKTKVYSKIAGITDVSGGGVHVADLLELVGMSNLTLLYNGGVEKAVVIVWDKQDNPHSVLIEEFLKTRLRELGAEVKPFVISAKLEEYHKSFITQIADTLLSSYNLISIDLCSTGELPTAQHVLRDRIREIALQHKPAYLIFRVCKDAGIKEVEILVSGLGLPVYEIHLDSTGAEFLHIAYFLCGQLEKLRSKKDEEVLKFNEVFMKCLEEKQKKLNRLLGKDGGIYVLLTRRGENESTEHYLMKIFVVNHIVETNGLEKRFEVIREKIRTEDRYCSNVIADVYYPDKGEVYEIETLYGVGPVVVKKLQETVEKYIACGSVKINIVVDNLIALLHFRELQTLQKTYTNISIKTIDIDNMRLVPIEEAVALLIETLK